jgi:ribose-phosphate pyrophosphokinase
MQRLQEADLDELVVTDTIPIPQALQDGVPSLKILSTAPMFGDAILRIHGGRSISEMME